MRSKLAIALLAAVIALLSHGGTALNEDEIVYENHTVNVGQLFHAKVKGSNIDETLLPSWITYNGTSVFGIPQIQLFYTLDGSDRVETVHLGENVYAQITFQLKEKNVCEFKETIFLEVYEKKEYKEYSTKEISDILQEFGVTMDLKVRDIRALPYNYLSLYRREANVVYTGDEEDPEKDVLVIIWILGCGNFDDDEDFLNTASVVNMNKYSFHIVQGSVLDINFKSEDYLKLIDMSKFVETTTLASMRTTRRADHSPKRINSMPSYKCVQGKTCKLLIPSHTFIDEEPAERLQYTVFSMSQDKSFLEANYPFMEGVPLESGTFNFRLEARDSMKQPASAPFHVVVESEPKIDYEFNTLVDKEFKHINGVKTCKFIDRLAKVLMLDAEKIRITSIRPGKGDWQTTISWLYLSHQTNNHCDTTAIYSLKRKMSTKKDIAHQAFVKNMGQEVHVREVSLALSGRCNTTSASSDSSLPTTAVSPKGTQKTTHSTDMQPTSKSENLIFYLVPVIFVIIAVVLIIIIIVYCCMFRKSGKKGKNQLDYVTKGQPVVFPNELATDDDTPSVATPMLVKDERPPLQPHLDGTTIHENPLYKAPSIPRTSVSTTNGQVNTASTFRQSGNVNQRLPPPYVSP